MCLILEIISRMDKNSNELKEDFDTKLKNISHSNLLSRFEEIEKLKWGLHGLCEPCKNKLGIASYDTVVSKIPLS